MLLTEARRTARVSWSGELVALDAPSCCAGWAGARRWRAAYDRAIELAGNTAETAYLIRHRDQLAGGS